MFEEIRKTSKSRCVGGCAHRGSCHTLPGTRIHDFASDHKDYTTALFPNRPGLKPERSKPVVEAEEEEGSELPAEVPGPEQERVAEQAQKPMSVSSLL